MLAFTTGYERLAGPVGLLDGERPNLIRFVFTDPRAQTAYPEWDRVAGERTASLPVVTRHGDPCLNAFIDELTATSGAAFADRLKAANPPQPTGVERLVVHLPADDASAAALDRLTGRRPGALRSVPDRTAVARPA